MRPYGSHVRKPHPWLHDYGVQTKWGGCRPLKKVRHRRAQAKSARAWAKQQIREEAP